MKELEQVHEVPMGTRTLKSLLKKPGHSKQRTQKNRVTINEKLNEFFAADYIILIKEECCADYEEECDCCCQEPEMIRLGNCKECRAEFTRQLAAGDIDTRFATERNGNKIIDNGCDVSRRVGAGVGGGCISVGGMGIGGSEESQEDEDEEDEDEEEEYEEEVDDDDNDEAESSEETDQRNNSGDPMTPVQLQAQTHETLSPPEGYKDVCDEDMQTEPASDMCPASTGAVVVCGECNYYRQRASGPEARVM